MGNSCQKEWNELLRCLSNSRCVREHPNPKAAMKDCAHPDAVGVTQACKNIHTAYTTCRLSQVCFFVVIFFLGV